MCRQVSIDVPPPPTDNLEESEDKEWEDKDGEDGEGGDGEGVDMIAEAGAPGAPGAPSVADAKRPFTSAFTKPSKNMG